MNKYIFLLNFIFLSACGGSSSGSKDNGGQDKLGATTYVGNVGGLQTTGQCGFENNLNVGGSFTMSCHLKNTSFEYVFAADMVNTTTGYADMTELPSGARMRIEITWHNTDGSYPPTGFDVTVNPFGAPTSYRFTKK